MVKKLTLELIERRLAEVGYSGPVNVDQQVTFIELMAKWNRKINLTALPLEPIGDEAVDRLIVEPVVASQFVGDHDIRIIDLGTGGGSPAIPFRIEVQARAMRMVESRSKKCAFLREATRTLGLQNTSVEESRFELLFGRNDLHHSADLMTIRAVRLDSDLMELIRFILAPGGRIFRFASHSEAQVPDGLGLDILSIHPLVPTRLSELQILSLS